MSLREIIREDQYTRVTLFGYLKQLRSVEWDNFIKDAKILVEESVMHNGPVPFGDEKVSKTDDLLDRFREFLLGIHASNQDLVLTSRPDSTELPPAWWITGRLSNS